MRASCAAHPRSRGENSGSSSRVSTNVGSSPLTRGKLRPRGLGWSALGLIPAHAGKTTYEGSVTFPRAAHPRSRGENALCCAGVGEYPGSSPLTRGKHVQESRGLAPSRLIPAHAGKTSGCKTVIARSPAHPRSRGENGWSARRALPSRGSSPLTRGKPIRVAKMRARDRLIPAHAGKTHFRRRNERGHWAHPRSRGENAAYFWMSLYVVGSSPLTRGKRHSPYCRRPPGRLIPAHAGKTASPPRRSPPTAAHPRSRGENSQAKTIPARGPGSSPLTRGKRSRG